MEQKLTPDRFKTAEYVRTIFSATVASGTKLEEVEKPEYWSHVASKLQPGSRIEVSPEDATWLAELYIVSCGRNWVKTCTLRFHELAESSPDEEVAAVAEYTIGWSGPIKKFRILRNSDKSEMKSGFTTKAEAQAWLADYQKALLV